MYMYICIHTQCTCIYIVEPDSYRLSNPDTLEREESVISEVS